MRFLPKIRAAAFVAMLASLVAFAAAGCNQPPPRDIQNADYESAEQMVRAADRIAHVRLTETTVHQVEAFQQGSGESLGTHPVTYLILETIESFKGSLDVGDTVEVAVEVPGLYEFRPGKETIEFIPGSEYVVFIKGRTLPSGYPPDYGGALWTPNGEPWIARVTAVDSLDFAVSDGYQRLVEGEEVPIELDLEGLRFLADS